MGRREEAERSMVSRALEREVVIHDDNSARSMYDLRVGTTENPEIAIECVGAVDPEFTETWNRGPAFGPFDIPGAIDWVIQISPKIRGAGVTKLKKHMAALLSRLESQGALRVNADFYLKRSHPDLYSEFESFGIESVVGYPKQETSARAYLHMQGKGGVIDKSGSTIPPWIGQFLRHPDRSDVLGKLEKTTAPERHVFVSVAFKGADWPVESYLMSKFEQLPSAAPDLPSPVTGVWIVSSSGTNRQGVRWNGEMWLTFAAFDLDESE